MSFCSPDLESWSGPLDLSGSGPGSSFLKPPGQLLKTSNSHVSHPSPGVGARNPCDNKNKLFPPGDLEAAVPPMSNQEPPIQSSPPRAASAEMVSGVSAEMRQNDFPPTEIKWPHKSIFLCFELISEESSREWDD